MKSFNNTNFTSKCNKWDARCVLKFYYVLSVVEMKQVLCLLWNLESTKFSQMIYNRQEFNGSLSISLCQRQHDILNILFASLYALRFPKLFAFFNFMLDILLLMSFCERNTKWYLVITKTTPGQNKVEWKIKGNIQICVNQHNTVSSTSSLYLDRMLHKLQNCIFIYSL